LQFSLNFSQILAIKNLKKHIILALIIFCIVFLAIYSNSQQKKGCQNLLHSSEWAIGGMFST
jgi:hypothetical protein